MGDVINLNRYRKAKARAEKERQAASNRIRHGRTRSEKATARREQERTAAELDGKRLDGSGEPRKPGPTAVLPDADERPERP
ncbi:MAG TPA: DUF4169 family protein [Nannocystis sp.]